MSDTIRFTDGAASERYPGVWSRLAGGRALVLSGRVHAVAGVVP